MISASRVMNCDISAMTITTDVRGRKTLADGGMQTLMMPDDELVKAADWCWNRFIGMKGKMPHDEVAALPPAVRVFHVEPLVVPGLAAERCLLWLRPGGH